MDDDIEMTVVHLSDLDQYNTLVELRRIIDWRLGVVIYQSVGGGVCCIPLSQTKLAEKEDK